MTPRLLPFGPAAVLAEVDSLDAVLALHARLRASAPAGVLDLVPAARTVLVRVDPAVLPLGAVRAWIAAGSDAAPARPGPLVEIPIVYDGADLADAASALGLAPAALAARHAACEWTVAFTGFAPGFGYLVSPGWGLDVPRRATPRTRVPAGAVGLAGAFSGAYPRATPGGWQLIGTTPAVLFDPDAARPAPLTPGARVRFVPTPATVAAAPVLPDTSDSAPGPASPPADPAAAPATSTAAPAAAPATSTVAPAAAPAPTTSTAAPTAAAPAGFEILAPGPLSTVQDLGRPGRLGEGIARSGAADRGALRIANRLVGNADSAAGIEVTMGGLRARARTRLWFAVTGAWGPVRLAGRSIDPYVAHEWPAGAELRIDPVAHGVRAYLAVRGGLGAPPTLGSRATDLLSGLGPARIAAGDAFPLAGAASAAIPASDLRPWSPPADVVVVEAAPGPRADWFTRPDALFETVWTVTADTDRVGIRLDGAPLARRRTDELPSEGMLPGAIQVPPSGMPVVFGPDGPVTGGYPVIAVVTDAGADALAQARPGTRVRFRRARPGS